MAADDRDILTLAEGKRVLRIAMTDTTQDDELEVYITASSRTMDEHFGHTVALTVTGELHDGLSPSGHGWRHKIILDKRPVTSIATVVEYRQGDSTTLTAESTTTQPADAYLPERYDPDRALLSGVIRRRSGGWDHHWETGRSNIEVTYTAGRVATTADVDRRFKRACGLVLANLWREREPGVVTEDEFTVPHQSFPAFAIPMAVKAVLAAEWDPPMLEGIA